VTRRTRQIEAATQRIGHEIFARARAAQPGPLELGWWQERGLRWSMEHEELRERLFRFIASLPGLKSPQAVARFLRDQFAAGNGALSGIPRPLALAVGLDGEVPLPPRWVAWAARFAADRMARRFIVGSTPDEALRALARMRERGMAFTLDILGETVTTPAEAEDYHRRYLRLIETLSAAVRRWPPRPLLDEAPFGPLPRANVSVKLSALSAAFSPQTASPAVEEVADRLRLIFRSARRSECFINVDMEHDAIRPATLEVFTRLLDEPEFRDWPHAGIALQAYSRHSRKDLDGLMDWVGRRGVPVTIRLVKGAYWDYETEEAARLGRASPVWGEKWQSDACFEELSTVLIESASLLRPAYGSHNVRSIAHALATAAALELPERTIELQMLHGMGDPLKTAVVQMNQRLRVYAPIGEWVPGVAYLVRRLLENTANESFLRQGFGAGVDERTLLAAPGRLPAPHLG